MSITVFAVTIEDYRRFEEAASVNDCRVPLSRLMGVIGSQVDSAEGFWLLISLKGLEQEQPNPNNSMRNYPIISHMII